MELASHLLLSEEIQQTMAILPPNLSKAEVSEYFGQINKPPKEIELNLQAVPRGTARIAFRWLL